MSASTKRKATVRLRNKMPLYHYGSGCYPRFANRLKGGRWNVKDKFGNVQWQSMTARKLRALISDGIYALEINP